MPKKKTTSDETPVVPDNAIGIEDLVRDRFYQVPKVLIWNEKYRKETNSDGKLVYAMIKDRFESSLDKTKKQLAKGKGKDYLTYVDENNKVFCKLDNQEIMFDLNLSINTAKKAVKQLQEAGLVFVQPKKGGANHLYLLKPDDTGVTFSKYMADKLWFKHLYSRENKKRLEGHGDKTYEEILAECEEKWGPSVIEAPSKPEEQPEKPNNEPENENEGQSEQPDKAPEEPEAEQPKGSSESEGVSKNDTLVGAKVDPLEGAKSDTREGQDLTPNNTELNQPDPKDTEPNSLIKSSSRDKTYPQDGDNFAQNELEEEEQSNESIELSHKTLITQESGYSVLKGLQMLKDEGICRTPRDFNVLCKTLKEEQVPSFELWLVTKHIPTHQARVAERENTPDAVDYEPAFFAYGLADAVQKEIRRQKGLEKRAARKRARENAKEYKPLPLYNWLENY